MTTACGLIDNLPCVRYDRPEKENNDKIESYKTIFLILDSNNVSFLKSSVVRGFNVLVTKIRQRCISCERDEINAVNS